MINKEKKYFLLYLLFLLSVRAFSEEGLLDFKKEQKFSIDFANVIIQVAKEIEQERPHLKLNDIDRETFEEVFKGKIDKFEKLYNESIYLSSSEKKVFKDFSRFFQVSYFYKFFIKMVKTSRVFFRKKSFGVAIAVLMGVVSDSLVPIILINSGLSFLIPVSILTPWSFTYIKIPDSIEKLRLRALLIKTLGSKKAYLDYLDQVSKVRSALKLETPDHFLVPLKIVDKRIETIVVSRTSWLRSLLGKWGFFQDSISYESIMRFIVTHNLLDNYTKYILTLDTGRDYKTAMLVKHILNTQNEDMRLLFRKKFSPHLFYANGEDTWKGLFDWTKEAMEIKKYDHLVELLKKMPLEMDIREFFAIYENMLLPKYAENFDIEYSEYRNLVRNFQELKAKTIKSRDLNFSLENRELFMKYLKKSFKKGKLSSCYNNHNYVIHYLLKSIR